MNKNQLETMHNINVNLMYMKYVRDLKYLRFSISLQSFLLVLTAATKYNYYFSVL